MRWLAPLALIAIAGVVALLVLRGGEEGGHGAGPQAAKPARTTHAAAAPAQHRKPRGRASDDARRQALLRRLAPPAHATARTLHVPILMYHRVHVYATEYTKSLPELTVEPARFAQQIEALARGGYHAVTVAQLYDALFHGDKLPSKPMMLTFDDGYVDDVQQVLPVLRQHHMTGVFFIITKRFHEQGFVNVTQLRRLDRAGMDIGAHTRDHVDLPDLPAATLEDEIAGSRRDLQRIVGHPVASFAYPAGRFDPASVAAVHQAGFALAVTTEPGSELSAQQPLELPRVRVNGSTTPAALIGCLDRGAACA